MTVLSMYRAVIVPISVLAVILGPFIDLSLLAVSALFMLKWITGESSCVFGLAECSLRQVPRSEGIINTVVDGTYECGVRSPMLPVLTAAIATIVAISNSE